MSTGPKLDSSGQADFANTRWSIVLKAGHQSSVDSRRALESLCQTYWHPLYAYVRRRVTDPGEAQDLTQAFFAELIEKNFVAAAKSERGRFRAFLLAAFKHFLSKQWDKAKTQKRGGGRVLISLDFEAEDSRHQIEPSRGLTPEQLYDREWALALLNQIMVRLEDEFTRAGKERQFALLKGFIIGEHEGLTYSAVAETLGMTEAAAKMAAHRMRRRYRELLREEIVQTVAGPEGVEEEIQNLFATLSH